MAKIILPLTDTEIKKAKSKEKDYKLRDGKGLYLLIKANGSKLWRYDYAFNGKRNTMSLGIYDAVSLKEARGKRDEILNNINKGISPNFTKNQSTSNTFKNISDQWFEIKKAEIEKSTFARNYAVIKNNCEDIMYKEMKDITRQDILKLINKMSSRGIYESIKRMLGQMYNIWKYAVTYEIVEHNIITDLNIDGIVQKKEVEHFAALTKEEDVRQLMKDIKEYRNNYKSDISTVIALELAPFLFFRSSNLRGLEWSEINYGKRLIEIPKNKMKNKKDFVFPISDFVIDKLKEIENYSKHIGKYVFVSPTHKDRCISENTLSNALKRMGYQNQHTIHGFRSTFSTWVYENLTTHGKHEDIIEMCLAHVTGGAVKNAYNRYDRMKYVEERRELIKQYEDYLNEIISR